MECLAVFLADDRLERVAVRSIDLLPEKILYSCAKQDLTSGQGVCRIPALSWAGFTQLAHLADFYGDLANVCRDSDRW